MKIQTIFELHVDFKDCLVEILKLHRSYYFFSSTQLFSFSLVLSDKKCFNTEDRSSEMILTEILCAMWEWVLMKALPPHCDQNMEKVPDLLPYDVKYAPHIRTAECDAGALLIHFLFWMTGMLTVMGRPEFLFDACLRSLSTSFLFFP